MQGDPAQVVLLLFDLTHDHIPSVPANPLLRHLDVFCQGAADVAGAPVLLAPTHARTQ